MTTTNAVLPWPRIEATTYSDGSGEVTINGTSYPVQEGSLNEARTAVLALVSETAAKINRPVRVTATGPDGQWPLIVHPDGTVEDDEATPGEAALDEQTRPLTVAPEAAPREIETADAGEAGTDQPRHEQHPVFDLAEPDASPTTWVRTAATAEPRTNPAGRQSFLTQEQIEEPATQGWRGFASRLGLRVHPSDDERAERLDVQAVSQHWPGPRSICIVNGKGGAGKTPATVSLAAVFARYGGAGVLAWDNNQTRGTLGWRTEQGPHEATLLDLLPQANRLLSTGAQSADLAHYVHHQTRDRFDVLRSKPMALADEQRVEPEDVDAIHAVAGKYYRLIFMDSGNDESDPMWLRMIDHADQLVVATTTRDDHAEAGALLLEALAQRDERSADLAARSIVVVSQADPKATASEIGRVAAGYGSLSRDAVAIPFDPAMVDGVLRYGSLRPATQRAWLAAAAAVARGL